MALAVRMRLVTKRVTHGAAACLAAARAAAGLLPNCAFVAQ